MGPFELMDLIGNDINFAVTKSVFEAFFFNSALSPEHHTATTSRKRETRTKKRTWLLRLCRWSCPAHTEERSSVTGEHLPADLVMLINEAVEALNLGIGSRDYLDLAMTKGVNYPKGLLKWADEKGLSHCLSTLERLQAEYGEDRYRPSPLLRRMVRDAKTFY